MNAMLEHIYGRGGGDWWINAMTPSVRQALIDGFVKVVQRELDRLDPKWKKRQPLDKRGR